MRKRGTVTVEGGSVALTGHATSADGSSSPLRCFLPIVPGRPALASPATP